MTHRPVCITLVSVTYEYTVIVLYMCISSIAYIFPVWSIIYTLILLVYEYICVYVLYRQLRYPLPAEPRQSPRKEGSGP